MCDTLMDVKHPEIGESIVDSGLAYCIDPHDAASRMKRVMNSRVFTISRTTLLCIRLLILVTAIFSLVAGTATDLLRLGSDLALPAGDIADFHGVLVMCEFLGTAINLERVIDIRKQGRKKACN